MPQFICNLIMKHKFRPRGFGHPAHEIAIFCAGYRSDNLKAILVHELSSISFILPVYNFIDPEFTETWPIYFRHDSNRFAVGMYVLMEPAIFFFQDQRKLFDLDSSIPSKCNRTSQWIMLEIDDIPGQS